MKTRISVLIGGLVLAWMIFPSWTLASGPSGNKDAADSSAPRTYDAEAMRIEGEQRYRANCGRCHAAPQKFPPRIMATVLRHMRVRATITDADMKLVLFYMSQ
jgi:hypothetical protein